MNKPIFAGLALALAATVAAGPVYAGVDEGSLSDKVMQDAPGTKGGTTANPTAIPETGSATQKAMQDLPGTKGGRTANPTGVPQSGALTQKAMGDHPGTR